MGKGVAEYPQIKENKGKGHLSSQVGVEVQQITHPWAGERKFRGEGPPPQPGVLIPQTVLPCPLALEDSTFPDHIRNPVRRGSTTQGPP